MEIYPPEKKLQLFEDFKSCDQHKILMEYVSNPLLVNGSKVDFRTYMLVASLQPKLVFLYNEAVFRKSDKMYDLHSQDYNAHIMNSRNQTITGHFLNYGYMKQIFSGQYDFGPNYIEKVLKPYLRKAHQFLFESEMFQFRRKNYVSSLGRFHIFALDWIIDGKGKIFLLEGNRFPSLIAYPKQARVCTSLWSETSQLIRLIHTAPWAFPGDKPMLVKNEFAFGGWELIYNELEAKYDELFFNKTYNPCTAFESS